ncbi:MAG: methyltransferase domain-containing protein [Campylobacterota bacterium]|nr:methyltransferase domain-containing protein [Campylobacterota bacterium]
MTKRFTDETLFEMMQWLQTQEGDMIAFELLNPDLGRHHYSGTLLTCKDTAYRYRSYKALSDLAELLFCNMLTPQIVTECCVRIRFEKLTTTESFHLTTDTAKEEKYGTDSKFSAINKNEEPAFFSAYLKALQSVKIENRKQILDLGINTGDEFELIKTLLSPSAFKAKSFIGVDHSSSAIEEAKRRFSSSNVALHVKDINALDALTLGRSDLLISIGTLQSPGIAFKPFFMKLVQNYLTPDGAIILGFPNCRWMDGEMIYGAKAPNYNYSEQSLLYNDVIFCKKYLQQHKYRVTLTGKQYLFLTATKILPKCN